MQRNNNRAPGVFSSPLGEFFSHLAFLAMFALLAIQLFEFFSREKQMAVVAVGVGGLVAAVARLGWRLGRSRSPL